MENTSLTITEIFWLNLLLWFWAKITNYKVHFSNFPKINVQSWADFFSSNGLAVRKCGHRCWLVVPWQISGWWGPLNDFFRPDFTMEPKPFWSWPSSFGACCEVYVSSVENSLSWFLKSRYCEKATKFEKNILRNYLKQWQNKKGRIFFGMQQKWCLFLKLAAEKKTPF